MASASVTPSLLKSSVISLETMRIKILFSKSGAVRSVSEHGWLEMIFAFLIGGLERWSKGDKERSIYNVRIIGR
jgi:hypothetical protein